MAKANPAKARAAVPARLPVVDRRAERMPEAEPRAQSPPVASRQNWSCC